ncbi:hypothetical protein [Rhodanobacter lindaniclasticus]
MEQSDQLVSAFSEFASEKLDAAATSSLIGDPDAFMRRNAAISDAGPICT